MLFSIIIGTLLFPITQFFPSTRDYGKQIYLYSVTLGCTQICNCNLRGREKLGDYAVSNIIHAIAIALLNIVFLLHLKKGIAGYFTAYIIANCVTIVYALVRGDSFNTIKNFKLDRKLMLKMAKYSVILIPNSLMWWIMNSSDRLMVTAMIGNDANGIYAIAYKVPTLLSTLSIIFNQAWAYSAIKEEKSSDKEDYHNQMYDKMTIIVIIITAGLLMIIKPFLNIYVSDAYYEAWKYTPYIMVGFLFMTMGTFLSTPYTVNKDSFGFLFSGIFGALINIVLNFTFIPLFGVTGAAIATCIGYFSIYMFRAIHTRKYVKINILVTKHIIGLALIMSMAMTMFIDNLFGQIILVIEFIIVIILMREFIINLFTNIKGIIRNVIAR
jgi:O-antigen/teichoic acid export membrane protein